MLNSLLYMLCIRSDFPNKFIVYLINSNIISQYLIDKRKMIKTFVQSRCEICLLDDS